MSVVALSTEPTVRILGLYDSREEAQEAGANVAVETVEDVDAHWPPDEVPDLVRAAGDESLAGRLEAVLRTCAGERAHRRALSPYLAEVRASLERGALEVMANNEKGARKAQAGGTTKAAAKKAAKPVARAAAGRKSNFADDAKIRLGTDKDKTPYGMTNNPVRKGTASAGRFAKIRDGMTVKEYRDKIAGKYTGGDLAWYSQRGYVTLDKPPATPASASTDPGQQPGRL